MTYHMQRAFTDLLLMVLLCASFEAGAGTAGVVGAVTGSATRQAPDGVRQELRRGDTIYEQDRIRTGARSFISLKFKDKSRFNLGANAIFRVDQVDDGSAGMFSAEIVKGAFRFVTGLIAKRRPRAIQIKTGAVATIGIRGTTVGGEVAGYAATIVLLESEDPAVESAIEVANQHGQVLIDKAGYGTRVPDAHSPPTPPARMTLRTIENLVRNINNIQRNAVPRPRLR